MAIQQFHANELISCRSYCRLRAALKVLLRSWTDAPTRLPHCTSTSCRCGHGLELSSSFLFLCPRFLCGDREGELMLYRSDAFPEGAICPASFLWKPPFGPTDMDTSSRDKAAQVDQRSLWIWYHPSAREELSRDLPRTRENGESGEEGSGKSCRSSF